MSNTDNYILYKVKPELFTDPAVNYSPFRGLGGYLC